MVMPFNSIDSCSQTPQQLRENVLWLDELGCTPEANPGDAIFFREDVLHRTQDTEVDRLTIIVDVTAQLPSRRFGERQHPSAVDNNGQMNHCLDGCFQHTCAALKEQKNPQREVWRDCGACTEDSVAEGRPESLGGALCRPEAEDFPEQKDVPVFWGVTQQDIVEEVAAAEPDGIPLKRLRQRALGRYVPYSKGYWPDRQTMLETIFKHKVKELSAKKAIQIRKKKVHLTSMWTQLVEDAKAKPTCGVNLNMTWLNIDHN